MAVQASAALNDPHVLDKELDAMLVMNSLTGMEWYITCNTAVNIAAISHCRLQL